MADIFDSDDDDVLNKPEATKASNKSKLPIYSSDEDDVIAPTTKDDTAGVSKPNLLAFLSDDEDDDAEPQPVSAAVTDDAKPIKSIFGDDLSEDEDDNKMEVVDSDNSSVKKVSKKSKSLGKSSQAKKAVVDSDNEQDLFNSDGEDLDEETEAQQVEKKNEALNQMLGAAKPEESILQTRVVEMEVGQRHGVPTGARKMFAKMPNFLRCQHQAYSKNSYDEAAETIAFTGATAIIRCMKKGDQMLSNARIVKWDDGSFQLVVANEVYNMRINPVDNW